MRSGARGPDSDVVITGDVAWTLHQTTVGYMCSLCGRSYAPGSGYWVVHGSDEPGRVCPSCFQMVRDDLESGAGAGQGKWISHWDRVGIDVKFVAPPSAWLAVGRLPRRATRAGSGRRVPRKS